MHLMLLHYYWKMEPIGIKNNKGLDCKDILGSHIIKYDLLTHEGKQMRDKVFQMMAK